MHYNFRVLTSINTYLSQLITPALIKEFWYLKKHLKGIKKELDGILKKKV